jgi:polysaccharide biosynthesis/export protein
VRTLSGAILSIALTAVGCGHATGSFVWIDELPQAEYTGRAPSEYVIAPGDLLNVQVYNQAAISTRARVRYDGKFTLPLVGDVEARGKRPAELAKHLEGKLKEFVVVPAVTVIVEEPHPLVISVLGEVSRPGNHALEASAGVIEALAAAGGPTDFASKDRIFVFRRNPEVRIRFTYERLTRGEGRGPGFVLLPGDVVVVE